MPLAKETKYKTNKRTVSNKSLRDMTNTKLEDLIAYPAFFIKGTKNPPKQESTWSPRLYFLASLAISTMGSITPWGNCGADPTS